MIMDSDLKKNSNKIPTFWKNVEFDIKINFSNKKYFEQ